MIKNFKTLDIWKRARKLVSTIYSVSKLFLPEEKFGLTSQINRASISIPSNIAEGCGRRTITDFSRFLDITIGSTCEVETQIYLAYDLNYISTETMESLTDEISQIRRMTISYQDKLNT